MPLEMQEMPGGPGVLGGVVLLDPVTRMPYRAQQIVQQTDAEFNTVGLATEEKQNAANAALQTLATRLAGVLSVNVQNQEHPLPNGAASASKQDQILSALTNLATLLGNPLTVSIDDQPLEVTIPAQALPAGAATGAKQDATNAALASLLSALTGTLTVDGSVGIKANQSVAVTGTVGLSNASIAVKPDGTFNVNVTGGATADKQDALLAAIGNLITAVQAPQPITDNGGSITVDGSVGVSGVVQSAQSGTWSVGITGTPNVNIANGPLAVTQSGSWTIQTNPSASATSGALTTFRSGAVNSTPVQVKSSSGRVYQYTIMNPNTTTAFANLFDALPGGVTVGTTAPKMSLPIPAGSTLDGYWSMSHGYATAISVSGSANWDGSGALTIPLQMTLGYA